MDPHHIMAFVLTFLVLGLILPSSPHGSAQTNPPAQGNWTVSDTTELANSTIYLQGNLTIATGGHLILRNCSLLMNSSYGGEHGIEVKGSLTGAKGWLEAYDTTFTANASGAGYAFNCAGKMTLTHCSIRNLWGSLTSLSQPGGLFITSSNALVSDCNITSYQAFGLVISGASPTITGTSVTGDPGGIVNHIGILVSIGFGITDPIIEGCTISYNLVGIQVLGAGMGVVSGEYSLNTLSFNGAGMNVMMATADVHHNDVTLNAVGLAGLGDSSVFGFNNITANGMGMAFSMGSDTTVGNNDISFNLGAGVMVNGSSPVTIDTNTISSNGAWGVLSQDSDPEIDHNLFSSNLGTTIQVENGRPWIYQNKIGLVTRGVFLLNCSDHEMNSNDVRGNGIGYEFDRCTDGDTNQCSLTADLGPASTGVVIRDSNMTVRTTITCGNDSTGIRVTNSEARLEGLSLISVRSGVGVEIANTTFTGTAEIDTMDTGVSVEEGSKVLLNNLTVLGPSGSTGVLGLGITDSVVDLRSCLFEDLAMGIDGHRSDLNMVDTCFQHLDSYAVIGNNLSDYADSSSRCSRVNGNENLTHTNITHLITNSTVSGLAYNSSYECFVDCPSFLPNGNIPVTYDPGSIHEVAWTTGVRVIDTRGTEMIGARVEIVDNTTSVLNTTATGSGGLAGPLVIPEYRVVGHDRTDLSPYTFKASTTTARGSKVSCIQTPSTVVVTIAEDRGPDPVAYLGPTRTHDPAPTLHWEEGSDPNGDDITYSIHIGTQSNGSDVLELDGLVNSTLDLGSVDLLVPMEYGPIYHIGIRPVDLTSMSGPWTRASIQLVNTPPVLRAAGPFSIDVGKGETLEFALNGSDADTEPVDELEYLIPVSSPEAISLNSSSGEVFWKPSIKDVGTHELHFSVSDGLGGTDTIKVNVSVFTLDRPPVADAGENITVHVGEVARLNGSGSYDPDSEPLRFRWVPRDSIPDLIGSTTPTPSFTPTLTGNYLIDLTVTDINGSMASDTVRVTVLKIAPVPDPAIVLSNSSCTPAIGHPDTIFIFRIELRPLNWSAPASLRQWLNGSEWRVNLTLDNRDTGYQLKIVDEMPDGSILVEAAVNGTSLGPGNHTYGFRVNFSEVEGPSGPFPGPGVLAGDTVLAPPDQDAEESTNRLWCISAIVIVPGILSIMAIVLYMRNQNEVEDPDGFPDGYWPHENNAALEREEVPATGSGEGVVRDGAASIESEVPAEAEEPPGTDDGTLSLPPTEAEGPEKPGTDDGTLSLPPAEARELKDRGRNSDLSARTARRATGRRKKRIHRINATGSHDQVHP